MGIGLRFLKLALKLSEIVSRRREMRPMAVFGGAAERDAAGTAGASKRDESFSHIAGY